MRVLNGHAGLGGTVKNLPEGLDITAVELDYTISQMYKKMNPTHTVICADVMQFFLNHFKEFDVAMFSPPCPTHSAMMKATRHPKKQYPDIALYQLVLFCTHFFKGKWFVENVKPYYEPLIKPTAIIGRHCFWANFEITPMEIKNHKNFINADSPEEIQSMKDWLGIQYEGNIYYKKNHSPGQILRNCVHPDLGLHVFNCMVK